MTLTLDFQGQILEMLYLRNGRADWHGTKGMWVDRMLCPYCDLELWPHLWPWPLNFKVKFWKSRNSAMGCQIDMEQKGCESIGCRTHIVTLNFDLTHDLDLGFSRSFFLPEASFGFRVLSLPASVCVSVRVCGNHLLVRTITRDPFKLGSPNVDQRCKRPWLRSPSNLT